MPLPYGKSAIERKWGLRLRKSSTITAADIKREKVSLTEKTYITSKLLHPEFVKIWIILSIAANEDLEMMKFDVRTAFTYGELEEDIYLLPPEGFIEKNDIVYKLQESLYELKQSPCCWNENFLHFCVN